MESNANESNIWIWPTRQENWSIIKSEKVWAVGTEGKGKRVQKGDIIVFYVNGTLYFHGAFRVTTDWHKPTVQWQDESFVGEWAVSEISFEEIQIGFASVNKLLSHLNFFEKKKS